MNRITLDKITVTYADVATCCQGAPDYATLSGLDSINKALMPIHSIDFGELYSIIYASMLRHRAHFGSKRPLFTDLHKHVTLFSGCLSHIVWNKISAEERKNTDVMLEEYQKRFMRSTV